MARQSLIPLNRKTGRCACPGCSRPASLEAWSKNGSCFAFSACDHCHQVYGHLDTGNWLLLYTVTTQAQEDADE
jgi:Zn finger protein HypA/HybF involved in hydrogenase expression